MFLESLILSVCVVIVAGGAFTCHVFDISLIGLQGVIDGDLCEQYNSMDITKKKSIAEDLDRTPSEV